MKTETFREELDDGRYDQGVNYIFTKEEIEEWNNQKRVSYKMNNIGLYRGKRVDGNHNWVEGSLLFSLTKSYIVNPANIDIGYNNTLASTSVQEVDYNTVSRFTGETSKNGKKIYFDTDILQTSGGNIVRVMFDVGQLSAYFARVDGSVMIDYEGVNNCNSVYLRRCIKIGNIFDNPELMEVPK